ncbi:uncharacterized protein RSE6_04042 [Rhynchosporium secalis]|uniref:RBR-type E3 ubiquitin transferase n=1 Tax=Rhynchosporium secalis TaxID=38038 RepID=A0A1E1M494_RHYSE|nr:uncharacterized protein RSE6_04042 [Rhynchosporium secalis]
MLDSNGNSTVFGLTIRDHDSRTMQHILRAYDGLPENPNHRHSLYLALTNLEKWLNDNEGKLIRDWLRVGGSLGDFPGPRAAQGPPINGNYSPATYPREIAIDGHEVDTEDDESNHGASTQLDEFPDHIDDISDRDAISDIDSILAGDLDDDQADQEEKYEEDNNEDTLDRRIAANGALIRELEAQGAANDAALARAAAARDAMMIDLEDGYTFAEPQGMIDDERSHASDDTHNQNDPELYIPVYTEERGYTQDELRAIYRQDLSVEHRVKIPSGSAECEICQEDFPLEDFLENITGHNHDDMLCCSGCIENAILYSIEDGRVDRVGCPICGTILNHEQVLKYSSAETRIRYNYLILSNTPGFIMCLGPKCDHGQMHPENHRENPVMMCESCNFLTCVVHKVPWHQGFSCEEFDGDESQIERLEADEATAKLLSENSKVCPTCKHGVTKTEGCDHLECRCGEAWCWECLASWQNILRIGLTAHARHCSNHPEPTRLLSSEKDARARTMAELVHGGPVSEALAKARDARNEKRRVLLRPLALEAAEKRAMEEAGRKKEVGESLSGGGNGSGPARKKVKLVQAWEER